MLSEMKPEIKIEIAENAGFCPGVQRAVDIAEKAAEKYGKVYTLGELIHNEDAVADLKRKGVYAVKTPDEAEGNPVVIRSHGVPKSVENEVREKCAEVFDATCPFVKRIHGIVSGIDSTVFVLGDKDHPEVVGIVGNASCKAY